MGERGCRVSGGEGRRGQKRNTEQAGIVQDFKREGETGEKYKMRGG